MSPYQTSVVYEPDKVALIDASATVSRIPLPSRGSFVFGIEVRVIRENGFFYIQSVRFDSLAACGADYPEAKEDFLQILNEAYIQYSQTENEGLSTDAVELKNLLEARKAYFLNAN